jgi:hypothetical protein
MKEMHALAEASAMAVCSDAGSDEIAAVTAAMAIDIAQAELADKLRAKVIAAASNSAESMAALRVAVCAFTVAGREEGLRPEAVLIGLKAIIHRETFESVWYTSTWSGTNLRQQISTWCIEDYFSRTECVTVT